uniref:RING-type domain-containing protein n=1 Tax=Globodera rostochiensis TaxID=31243 RepID=A0A914HAZ8_GLORO
MCNLSDSFFNRNFETTKSALAMKVGESVVCRMGGDTSITSTNGSFSLLNVLVTLLGIANGAGTSAGKQKDASGKQPMQVDGAVQEKLNVNECAICLEEIETGEIQLRTLPCAHVFHQCCIQPWLIEHNTCPKCRNQISNEEDTPEEYLNRNLGNRQNINMEINDGNSVQLITYGDLNIHVLERSNGRIAINGHPISNEAWTSQMRDASEMKAWQMRDVF